MGALTRTKGRSYSGKLRHDSEAAAVKHRLRLIAKGAVRLAVYWCRHCNGGWHVGHLPKPRRTK
jgi:hypothetical protein